MQELITELTRLYLLDEQRGFESGGADPAEPVALSKGALEQHLLGVRTLALELQPPGGMARAIVLDFSAGGPARGEQQWRAVAATANALRDTFELPSPAVSISGHGFQLWLSLQAPQPLGRIAEFAALLRDFCMPEPAKLDAGNASLAALAALPPGRLANGKWLAFIHPGMGASFADDPALEMAPPLSAQLGFLEGLHSITPSAFDAALAQLRREQGVLAPAAAAAALAATAHAARGEQVLLAEATLEEIVRELHARHIEPSFRHLLGKL